MLKNCVLLVSLLSVGYAASLGKESDGKQDGRDARHASLEPIRKKVFQISVTEFKRVERDVPGLDEHDTSTVNKQEATSLEDGDTAILDARDATSLDARDATSLDERDATSLDARDATSLDARDSTSLDARDATSLDARDATSLDARDSSILNQRDTVNHENRALEAISAKVVTLSLIELKRVEPGEENTEEHGSKAPVAEPLGCYKDDWDRALRNPHYIALKDSMTPEMCMEACRSYQSYDYKHAGVEAGSQCFCGENSDFDRHGVADNCDMTCTGDSSRTCGGRWAIEIYKL